MEEDEFFFKIFILGEVNIGKTCFLTRYLDNTFSEETKNTIGIDFRLKTVQIEDGSTVKLQIFETNENINTSPILKFDLKSSHGIILTFSVISKKSFENIPKWIKQIKEVSNEEVPIFLVGNMNDNEEKREITREEGEKLAKEYYINYYECSSKTGKNINLIFDELLYFIIFF